MEVGRARLRLRGGIRLPAEGAASSCSKARSNTSSGCAPRTSNLPSRRKAGTPVTPIDTASLRRCGDAVEVAVESRARRRPRPPQPGRDRVPTQHVVVAEVLALGPVRVHQPVVERLVQTCVPRQLRHSQRRARVRDVLRERERELRRLHSPTQQLVRPRAVTAPQLVPRDPFRRVLRVEVEQGAT